MSHPVQLVQSPNLPVPKEQNSLKWAVETNHRNDEIAKEGNPTVFPLAFLLPQTFGTVSCRLVCAGLFHLSHLLL